MGGWGTYSDVTVENDNRTPKEELSTTTKAEIGNHKPQTGTLNRKVQGPNKSPHLGLKRG